MDAPDLQGVQGEPVGPWDDPHEGLNKQARFQSWTKTESSRDLDVRRKQADLLFGFPQGGPEKVPPVVRFGHPPREPHLAAMQADRRGAPDKGRPYPSAVGKKGYQDSGIGRTRGRILQRGAVFEEPVFDLGQQGSML